MNETIISLISILGGIIGANLTSVWFQRFSLKLTGNTIIGVFGSVFFIKLFGRLGFDPVSIMESGEVNYWLLGVNLLVSFVGGMVGVVLVGKLKRKMDRK